MRVREAVPADAPAICRVHEAAIAAFGPEAYDDDQVAAWRGDRSASDYDVGAAGERWLVAERGGEVGGFGVVVEEVGEEFGVAADAEVQAVYVHPEAARAGAGTALLAGLEGHAREFGADDVALHASLNAVGFYRRRGYERVAERDHEFGDGVDGTVVEMYRQL